MLGVSVGPDQKVNVMVIYCDDGWGTSMVLRNLTAILNQAKFRVFSGIIMSEPAQATRLPVPPGVKAIKFHIPHHNFNNMICFFAQLSSVLKEHHIQILHGGSAVALMAAMYRRVPITITHWHGSYGLHKWKTRLSRRFWAKFSTLNIAVSHSTKEYVTERLGIPPDRIKVIHNGIEVVNFQSSKPRERVRRDLGVPLEVPVVGLVARLAHWGKGHRELFSAMAALRPRYPLHALIVGDGWRRPAMEKMVQDLGLADVVHFLGTRYDIADLLTGMDIFVLPSQTEGISLSILEAMAAGLPVIASRVGGTPEIIRHKENGILIPVGDSQALADNLARLLEDPALARQLGDAGRKDAYGYFSLDRMGREIEETYEALIQEKLKS